MAKARSARQPAGRGVRKAAAASLIARADRLGDLLPQLHQWAIEATGGSSSLLFIADSDGRFHATSGFALEALPTDPWFPSRATDVFLDRARVSQEAVEIPDARKRAPDLASRLGNSRGALVMPLRFGPSRTGLLAIGSPSGAPRAPRDAREIADAFGLAIQLFSLRDEQSLHREALDMLNDFITMVSSTLDIEQGLDLICDRASRLFGADRTSVWFYDRTARHLDLRASSDREYLATRVRVAADDALAVAAVAMRTSRAEVRPGSDATRTLTVPLRGYRRALGALVLEGVRVESFSEPQLLLRADELGRQLSSAIDSLQLLDNALASHRELEGVFDSLPYLIALTDERNRLVRANSAFAQRVGVSREQLRGRPLKELVGAEIAEQADRHARAIGTDAIHPATVNADPVLKGTFAVTIGPRIDGRGHAAGLVLIARDLAATELRATERELQRARATQSEKLAALGQLVAGVAHELNNPLQGVLGHVELLRATRALPRTFRPSIRAIHREADRAAKIVRNLLVFSGSRRITRRTVNLHAVLQRAIALRQAACRSRDITVVRHYADVTPRVHGDPFLLHQAFLNMLLNAEEAIEAAQRGGRIEVATTINETGRVTTTIHDSGEGIRDEALTRIFEPFFTTKDVGQGTGLGMAIAYGIVHEHGGVITAANHPSGGAVMTVDLPLTAARNGDHE